MKPTLSKTFLVLIGLLLGSQAWAADPVANIVSTPMEDGSTHWSLPIQTLVLLTAMKFLPAIILMMTAFTRIIIVLGLLRTAMGTQTSPPNQVLIGISLLLTFFIMSPVLNEINQVAWTPLSNGDISMQQAIALGMEPVREFMLAQTRQTDLATFAQIAGLSNLNGPEDVPFSVLLPAFVTSELQTAFQIGFTLFIPFLIIDLVVSSTLMALGMMMVPPITIALPFKLMLFVLVDGWSLIMFSISQSFYFA